MSLWPPPSRPFATLKQHGYLLLLPRPRLRNDGVWLQLATKATQPTLRPTISVRGPRMSASTTKVGRLASSAATTALRASCSLCTKVVPVMAGAASSSTERKLGRRAGARDLTSSKVGEALNLNLALPFNLNYITPIALTSNELPIWCTHSRTLTLIRCLVPQPSLYVC